MERSKKKKDKITSITIRFPSGVIDALRVVAQQEERSLNATVIRAIREYVARQSEEKERDTHHGKETQE